MSIQTIGKTERVRQIERTFNENELKERSKRGEVEYKKDAYGNIVLVKDKTKNKTYYATSREILDKRGNIERKENIPEKAKGTILTTYNEDKQRGKTAVTRIKSYTEGTPRADENIKVITNKRTGEQRLNDVGADVGAKLETDSGKDIIVSKGVRDRYLKEDVTAEYKNLPAVAPVMDKPEAPKEKRNIRNLIKNTTERRIKRDLSLGKFMKDSTIQAGYNLFTYQGATYEEREKAKDKSKVLNAFLTIKEKTGIDETAPVLDGGNEQKILTREEVEKLYPLTKDYREFEEKQATGSKIGGAVLTVGAGFLLPSAFEASTASTRIKGVSFVDDITELSKGKLTTKGDISETFNIFEGNTKKTLTFKAKSSNVDAPQVFTQKVKIDTPSGSMEDYAKITRNIEISETGTSTSAKAVYKIDDTLDVPFFNKKSGKVERLIQPQETRFFYGVSEAKSVKIKSSGSAFNIKALDIEDTGAGVFPKITAGSQKIKSPATTARVTNLYEATPTKKGTFIIGDKVNENPLISFGKDNFMLGFPRKKTPVDFGLKDSTITGRSQRTIKKGVVDVETLEIKRGKSNAPLFEPDFTFKDKFEPKTFLNIENTGKMPAEFDFNIDRTLFNIEQKQAKKPVKDMDFSFLKPKPAEKPQKIKVKGWKPYEAGKNSIGDVSRMAQEQQDFLRTRDSLGEYDFITTPPNTRFAPPDILINRGGSKTGLRGIIGGLTARNTGLKSAQALAGTQTRRLRQSNAQEFKITNIQAPKITQKQRQTFITSSKTTTKAPFFIPNKAPISAPFPFVPPPLPSGDSGENAFINPRRWRTSYKRINLLRLVK